MSAEVADQAKVLLAADIGQRPVVVDARDGLHAPTVAMAQATAVHGLGLRHIRRTILAQRNFVIARQATWHARHPQPLIAHGAQGELLHIGQLLQANIGVGMHTGDQFHLGFAEIGGDMGVREGRAQRLGVRGHGQHAAGQGAQAFFFHAAADSAQAFCCQGAQGRFSTVHA